MNLKISNLKSLNTESKLDGWAKISSLRPAELGYVWQEVEEDSAEGRHNKTSGRKGTTAAPSPVKRYSMLVYIMTWLFLALLLSLH